MVNKPPHLPTETCRVDTHYKMQNLRWILFIFFIATLSGVSASLITVAWLTPAFTTTDYYGIGHDNKNFVRPDAVIVKQTKQKVLDIYDRRKITDKTFYSERAFLSKAAILSSDGWAVAYYSDYVSGEEKNWDILDYQGVVYKVQKSFFDSVSKLVYFKVDGQGFRVVSFSPSNNLNADNYFWLLDKNLTATNLISEKVDTQKVSAVWQPKFSWRTALAIESGNLLFGAGGDLVAIVEKDSLIVPAWLLENQLNSLLSKQAVSYNGLPWKGYFVSNVLANNAWKEIAGFYVSEAAAYPTKTSVGKGDVIIKINNQDITPENLSEQILTAPNEFEVVVYRKGEEVKILVKKQIVK